MTPVQLVTAIENGTGRTFSAEQLAVIHALTGPQWVIAGPGSGKTEVLVTRCLKLSCADNVPPKSIILTTFTEKAARNIRDRLALYKSYLDAVDPAVRQIDVFQVRVSTLHALCNDVLQEYRYTGYQNYRLLNEIDQLLFVYDHSRLAVQDQDSAVYLPFWRQFAYMVDRFNYITQSKWSPTGQYLPHRWLRAYAAVDLFNRIVEEEVDIPLMRQQGGNWALLADAYVEYRDCQEVHHRCDFAHLQQKFLRFLSTPSGNHFCQGDGTFEHPGINFVLVDEYQDTNPIQEHIYIQLADRGPHNLCVVGDDDQALYRFRGGTVDCMVRFDEACRDAWSIGAIQPLPLSTNYRSHPQIVRWIDDYIRSFTVMTANGARVANKPTLTSDPDWAVSRANVIMGNYPPLSYLDGANEQQLATDFAGLVRGLRDNNIVADYSQCVLLIKSTKDKSARMYQTALEAAGVPTYNPRSKTFLQNQEVQAALGALVSVIDEQQSYQNTQGRPGILGMVQQWIGAYSSISQPGTAIATYVQTAQNVIRNTPAGTSVKQRSGTSVTTVDATIQEIFYHILACEPFRTWLTDTQRAYRLGKLTQLLEAYCSQPYPNSPGSTRGTIRTGITGATREVQLRHFYSSLVGLLVSEGVNDPEDEEITCPPGLFPIMTIHQAKGLQFPFVFVAKVGKQTAPIGRELRLEDDLRAFRARQRTNRFTLQDRADQDYIRLFYVAYSRSEYGLILLCTTDELKKQGLGFGGLGRNWFRQRAQDLKGN